jgi:integrase
MPKRWGICAREQSCRGTPRFKRKAMERFLSPPEYRRLGLALDQAEETHPAQVAAIRLLLYTGARSQEIGGLQWDWVQAPRLLLPDSKTGPKTIWLCSQAVQILESLPRREGCPFVFPTEGRCTAQAGRLVVQIPPPLRCRICAFTTCATAMPRSPSATTCRWRPSASCWA